jgi:hypothetical protein
MAGNYDEDKVKQVVKILGPWSMNEKEPNSAEIARKANRIYRNKDESGQTVSLPICVIIA